ncbi:MAG: ATP-binding cassette domain-containing protein [Gammaproteobacteria bacterium]|nr:ATP-binding cassette domain-containing protein [Gammaproteobacteria bacterium]MYF38044.1 ATP-binding cassette domain-containing protein [Gammaproteobacteria bacterium]
MLKADNLTRTYDTVVAVDDVSFETSPGEIVGLLGHNGAGKTTVMKLLTGFIEPNSGNTFVDGINVQESPVAARANLGYLPENRPLYRELSVVDYLWFSATARGIPSERRRECVERAVRDTDLTDRAMDNIGTLSRGFQQRVGVAQAILHQPGALILDEPTNGLDPSQTQHMRELIRDMAKESTVMLSTHIMQEVEAICNRVLIMRDGMIVVDEFLENLKEGDRCWLRSGSDDADIRTAVEPIATVQKIDGRYLLGSREEDSKCDIPAIVRELVAKEIEVNSIEPEKRDLEALFRSVSEGGI